MNKRVISALLVMAMLLPLVPQAALATTAQEALFGNGGSVDTVDNNAIYGFSDDTAAAGATATPAPAASSYPTLKLGDKDSKMGATYITLLQNRLVELGYLSGSADGNYGENTASAVHSFQKNNGLPATGVADAATQIRMYQDNSTLVEASIDTAVYGSDTTRVQTLLTMWGFMSTTIDGTYGKSTANAIKRFKQYMGSIDNTFGVTPSPVPTSTPIATSLDEMPVINDTPLTAVKSADERFSGKIDNALMEYIEGKKTFPIYNKTVKKGMKGDDVWRVQRRLRSLNYLYKPDGEFGALTKAALKYFQRVNGLEQSGVADKKTQKLLFSSNAKKSKEFVFPYKYWVDVSEQRVYVGKWTGKDYSKIVHKFKCSTGKADSPTPLGTYQAAGITGSEWYYFKAYGCYAKWATRIYGGILFHSIIYNSNKKKTGSEASLGHRAASHGCVRLSVKDAKWIYMHCPSGTTVVVRK